MKYEDRKARSLISLLFNKGYGCRLNFVLGFSLFTLSGCVLTGASAPSAPAPPEFTYNYNETLDDNQGYAGVQPRYFADPGLADPALIAVAQLSALEPKAGVEAGVSPAQGVAVSPSVSKPKKCRFKDRFDRKALVAYEWNRSRMSVDVDGINLSPNSDRAIRFQYRLKFQPEKTKAERCRYASSWQGLLGSGYNEFFIREEDTVWGELRGMKAEVHSYVERIF